MKIKTMYTGIIPFKACFFTISIIATTMVTMFTYAVFSTSDMVLPAWASLTEEDVWLDADDIPDGMHVLDADSVCADAAKNISTALVQQRFFSNSLLWPALVVKSLVYYNAQISRCGEKRRASAAFIAGQSTLKRTRRHDNLCALVPEPDPVD